jgi:hypothetical protein
MRQFNPTRSPGLRLYSLADRESLAKPLVPSVLIQRLLGDALIGRNAHLSFNDALIERFGHLQSLLFDRQYQVLEHHELPSTQGIRFRERV